METTEICIQRERMMQRARTEKQTCFGRLIEALGGFAVVLFFLWLPFLSGSGLYDAIDEVGRMQSYRDGLDTQPSLSAVAFADSAPGRTVVLEGTVSARTPTVFRDTLVIFIHYTSPDNTQSSGWRERERVLRPLVLEIGSPNARVQVESTAANAPEAHYDVYGLALHFDETESRRYGLVHGEPVLVLGTVVSAPERPYLDAAMVCAGDRASCAAELGQEHRETLVGAAILGVITLALGAVALVVVVAVVGGGWRSA